MSKWYFSFFFDSLPSQGFNIYNFISIISSTAFKSILRFYLFIIFLSENFKVFFVISENYSKIWQTKSKQIKFLHNSWWKSYICLISPSDQIKSNYWSTSAERKSAFSFCESETGARVQFLKRQRTSRKGCSIQLKWCVCLSEGKNIHFWFWINPI